MQSAGNIRLIILDLVAFVEHAVSPHEGPLEPIVLCGVRVVGRDNKVDFGSLACDPTLVLQLIALNLRSMEADSVETWHPFLGFSEPR